MPDLREAPLVAPFPQLEHGPRRVVIPRVQPCSGSAAAVRRLTQGDILGLDVAVYHAFGVGMGKRVQYLLDDD